MDVYMSRPLLQQNTLIGKNTIRTQMLHIQGREFFGFRKDNTMEIYSKHLTATRKGRKSFSPILSPRYSLFHSIFKRLSDLIPKNKKRECDSGKTGQKEQIDIFNNDRRQNSDDEIEKKRSVSQKRCQIFRYQCARLTRNFESEIRKSYRKSSDRVSIV